MTENLEDLTKEDLIRVIATMHDVIRYWDTYYCKKTADKLEKIGEQCLSKCLSKYTHELNK